MYETRSVHTFSPFYSALFSHALCCAQALLRLTESSFGFSPVFPPRASDVIVKAKANVKKW